MNRSQTIIKAKSKAEYLNLVNFFRLQGFKFAGVWCDEVKQTTLCKDSDTVIIYIF